MIGVDDDVRLELTEASGCQASQYEIRLNLSRFKQSGKIFAWACLIFQRSAKSIIDVCVSHSYSYQEIAPALFLHTNISKCPAGGGGNLL